MDLPREIIEYASAGRLDRKDVDTYCVLERISADEFYNHVALQLARDFVDGSMSFDDADAAMNCIWSLMVDEAAKSGDGFTLAEPAYAIYDAFDSGEYGHGDGKDPVEAYARPALKRILREWAR